MSLNVTLQKIIENGSKRIREIDGETMLVKPSDEKWSKNEILGHLVDSAIINYQRIMLAQLKEDLIFDGYDQVNWVQLNGYRSRNTEEILKIWEAINTHISQVVSTISESIMNRKTVHHNFDTISMQVLRKDEESNLHYLIWDYIFHVEHHLAQIIDGYENMNVHVRD